MANRRFTQFFNTFHKMPVLLDCNFVVDSTNGNGLGIRSLKGPGIQNVFMHTSASPAVGNPNPGLGRAIIVLQDNYNKYYGGFSGFVSQLSGSTITSGLVVGSPYVIVSVGASTLAQWQTAGVPAGITPAVGVAFIALATSVAGGGAVQAPSNSGISSVEVVGDPNTTIQSSKGNVLGISSGAYIIVHFMAPKTLSMSGTTHTSTTVDGLASTAGLKVGQAVIGAGIPLGDTIASIVNATSITLTAAATASATVPLTFPDGYGVVQPADGATCGMSFYMSNSSIIVQGE